MPLGLRRNKFKAKRGVGFRCSKFNGVIWLNAKHLGGCAFRFATLAKIAFLR